MITATGGLLPRQLEGPGLVGNIAGHGSGRGHTIGGLCAFSPRARGRRSRDFRAVEQPSGHTPQDTEASRVVADRLRDATKIVRRDVRRRDRGQRPQLQKTPASRLRNHQPGGAAATVAGDVGPGFHTWPPGHILQATDTNPLPRSPPSPLLKNRSERCSAPRPGSAPPATENTRIPHPKPPARRHRRHCSWGRWPRFPPLAPRPHPSRHGGEIVSSRAVSGPSKKSFRETGTPSGLTIR